MAGSYFGNSLTQTSSSSTTYAGGGAWGQQGTASWTTTPGLGYVPGPIQHQFERRPAFDSMLMQSSMRLTIPMQRIYMPTQTIWSAWNDSGDNYTTETTAWDSQVPVQSVEFQQRVWGQWVEHQEEQSREAAMFLNERGLEEVRRENARREQEYLRARELAELQAENRAVKAAEEAERKKTAEELAQVLLGEIIGEEQLAVYKETGRLLVNGKKHDYLVHKSGGVQRVEKGKIIDLCVHVSEKILIPPTDNVIGLAMHIKADEKDFNKVANASAPAPRPKELAAAANY